MKKMTLLVTGLMLSGMFAVVQAEEAKPMGDAAKPAVTSTEAKPTKKIAKKRVSRKKKEAAASPATTPVESAAPANGTK